MNGPLLIVVIAVVVAALGGLALVLGRRTDAGRARGSAGGAGPIGLGHDPTPDQIVAAMSRMTIGHQLSYMTVRWDVTGWVDYDEDGYRWREYRLHHIDEWAWLAVDPKADPPALLFKAGEGTWDEPGAPAIVDNGVTFTFRERGRARYVSHGRTDMAPSGTVEYVDYQIRGGRRVIAFERYGDKSWEVTKGEAVELPYVSFSVASAGGASGPHGA